MIVKLFRATRTTKRFNVNQRVWVRHEFANHLHIWFKWRGSGRYVSGVIDKFKPEVGELKEIEVSDEFAYRIDPLSSEGAMA